MTTTSLPLSLARNTRLDRWVAVRPDGVIEIRTGKVEIGQGIISTLAQIAAEELDVDYGRIRMIPADTGRSPNEGVTAGSRSTVESGSALRQACRGLTDLAAGSSCSRGSGGQRHLTDRRDPHGGRGA